MNLPNFISLGRLFLAPLMVWLILDERFYQAVWVFIIAGVSDILDGLLARLLKNQTTVGRYLDPVADKVLLVAVFLTLGMKGYFPAWFVILAVFRDIMILGGALMVVVFSLKFRIEPVVLSKLNTFLQILLVLSTLMALEYNWPSPYFLRMLLLVATGTTVLSGLHYVFKWVRGLNAN